ncbi:hypothetical protein [Janthinobacterium rivuli]|uniref:hypothetical protein n=1 Tax=Janthinobacterium rivuli TaxID=2751478 RepID=UPI00383ADD3C
MTKNASRIPTLLGVHCGELGLLSKGIVQLKHALDLAYHVDVELIYDFLVRGRLGRRYIGNNCDDLDGIAPPAEAAEQA